MLRKGCGRRCCRLTLLKLRAVSIKGLDSTCHDSTRLDSTRTLYLICRLAVIRLYMPAAAAAAGKVHVGYIGFMNYEYPSEKPIGEI